MQTLRQVLQTALDNLSHQITTYFPPLLAAMTILVAAYILASLTRWLLMKTFKGAALDRFLRESGLSSILFRSRGLASARLVTNAVFWIILLAGVLTGLNAFDSKITSRMVESTVFILPKLVTAGLILLAGAWLAQYLGRTVLVWACNEEIPHPRRWAAGVRTAIGFTSVVVAADTLNFASSVFLAAFIITAGGAVLAVSLALGLGGRAAAERFFLKRKDDPAERREEAVWRHL
jgi:mechanosensitive ion channel-like protein